MGFINILINIILATKVGIFFSVFICIVFFLVYLIKVKNYPITLHLRIMNHLKNRFATNSHENNVNSCMERYYAFVKKPNIISIIIPLLIVLIIGYILYNQIVFFAVVGSGSMEPTFKKSDLILMQNFDINIEEGDIIMFETPTVLMPITHRVIKVSGNGIFTKGDARSFRDDWIVKYDQIRGKAITVNEKPIIIKDVGTYFIEDFESGIVTQRYNEEIILMRKIIASIKSLGLIIFFFAIFMYILSSIKS